MESGGDLPRGKPAFVHAVANDEATAMPMDEGGVFSARIQFECLGYQYGCFERMLVDDSVCKVDPVKGIEDAGRHLRVEVVEFRG